ncbi:MAG: prepilin-type N-terminal cleavage/methylation domain-containing protein [Phycisphaeraceae bacterium]
MLRATIPANVDRRAFTLIEMLVVISLITLLIALLLPSLGSSRWNAIKTRCGVQMRQIAVAADSYSVENYGWFIPARVNQVQIAIDPPQQKEFDRFGYPKDHWRCPGRDYEPQIEPGFGNQLVIGYQYYGGIKNWTNLAGTQVSKSPIRREFAKSGWVIAADTTIKVDGVWGGGRPEAFGDMPSHRRNNPWPVGGNQAFVDGSTRWVPFQEMYVLHSWSPTARMCFIKQEDLPAGLTLNLVTRATDHMQ